MLELLLLLAQDPQPRVIDPGGPGKAPSDAVVLFGGKDVSAWRRGDGQPARCEVREQVMHCRTGAGDIFSRETFRAAQIHIEFAIPAMPRQKGQLRGNSGVYLQSCYEIQLLDSYQNPTYAKGSAGALYGLSAPMVNASRPAKQWQVLDIIFRPPRCDAAGKITGPGSLTLLHNGVLVQDHVPIEKATGGCSLPNRCDAGPLMLQDHSGFPGAPDTTMRFRNIWVRRID
ncbi:MAG: 3-keto-disaccharide hydrolase [Bryobacteraceae bacterium]